MSDSTSQADSKLDEALEEAFPASDPAANTVETGIWTGELPSSPSLERMGDSNAESSMIRTYLDWLLAIPWAKRSKERLDPAHARAVLDADHEGLDA